MKNTFILLITAILMTTGCAARVSTERLDGALQSNGRETRIEVPAGVTLTGTGTLLSRPQKNGAAINLFFEELSIPVGKATPAILNYCRLGAMEVRDPKTFDVVRLDAETLVCRLSLGRYAAEVKGEVSDERGQKELALPENRIARLPLPILIRLTAPLVLRPMVQK